MTHRGLVTIVGVAFVSLVTSLPGCGSDSNGHIDQARDEPAAAGETSSGGVSAEDQPSAGSKASGGAAPGSAGTSAAASTAGDAGADVGACSSSADCDDGSACNGSEVCVAGHCAAGTPVACDQYMECSDADGGSCIYSDQSPWVAYQADDDVLRRPEVYALKRDLIGKMAPIKLHPNLEREWQAEWNDGWAPNGELLAFGLRNHSTDEEAVEIVYFGRGAPRQVARLSGMSVRWAPTGHAFALNQGDRITFYDYLGQGQIEEGVSFGDADTGKISLRWGGDSFFFSSTSIATEKSSIWQATRDKRGWTISRLLKDLDLFTFSVSPSGKELIYELNPADGDDYGATWATSIFTGTSKQLVPENVRSSWRWSSDASQFLLLETVDNHLQVWSGSQGALGELVRLAPDASVASADFLSTRREVVVRVSNEFDDLYSVQLFDPAVSTDEPRLYLGDTYRREPGPLLADDGDSGLLPISRSGMKLELFRVSGIFSTVALDSIPENQEYDRLSFSHDAKFVAYTKGISPDYDGAYIDLRFRYAEPVRIPGEGDLYQFFFDPSAAGLYYVREKDETTRDCFYIDLTSRDAKDPVKVSGGGRVDWVDPAPLVP